ncbi:MAG: hypothetical protein ACREBG_17780 [Pyrinomonadaceae bacterium]
MSQAAASLSLAVLIFLVPIVSLSPQTGGTKHAQYKAQRLSGVATYQNSGEVGNAIFTLQPTKFDQKEYTGILNAFEFGSGNVPKLYCRRFFPSNLKEAVDYIKTKEPTASDFKMQTNFKLMQGSDLLGTGISETPLRPEILADPTYNTAHAEVTDTDLIRKLPTLGPGQYAIVVETYVTYQYVTNRMTGAKGPSNILLAAGKLPVFVE